MKKSLVISHNSHVVDNSNGETYSRIVRYFIPEYIISLVIYSMPFFIDSYFIGQLESTSSYAALGSMNNLLHFLIKIAEAFSIGTVIVAGNHNGKRDFKEVGRAARDSLWMMLVLGFVFSIGLFFGAQTLCEWYRLSDELIAHAVPFLRLRAVGVFFTFASLALIGFLRGIKNSKAPMKIFMFGALVFLFFDYTLIFGNFGFPRLGLLGSAYASVIQYATIFVIALGYVLFNEKYRKYAIDLFKVFKDKSHAKKLIKVSWPIILDKATMAGAYIWLGRVISPLGTNCVASFCVIKDMERFAFLPAIACAQVITFLVSNDFSIANWNGIRSNIKKVIFLSAGMVLSVLIFFSMYAEPVATIFDKKGDFAPLAARAFPIISVLVVFDLLQLILSGALRGAGNVKTVMIVRLIVCLGYFVPVSHFLSRLPIRDEMLKVMLVYGAFYIGNGIMSVVYIWRLRGDHWNKTSAKD